MKRAINITVAIILAGIFGWCVSQAMPNQGFMALLFGIVLFREVAVRKGYWEKHRWIL